MSHKSIKNNKNNNKISIKKIYRALTCNNIITYNEYKQYLNDILKNDDSKDEKIFYLSAIDIRGSRFTNYENLQSNKQFTTLFKTYNVLYSNRFNEMIEDFVTKEDAAIILNMIKNKKSDNEIYNFIKTHYKKSENESKENKEYKISRIAKYIKKYLPKNTNKPLILDVGCGTGKKITMLNSFINSNIYGADIESWGSYAKNRKFNFPFKNIQINPYKIPYPDKMFDCITIMLVLHHADNIIKTINECKRILKDDGILVIIEHDIWTDESNMIVDIQHKIYTTIFNESPDSPEACYFNVFEWNLIFNKCGMYPIFAKKLEEDITSRIRYDMQTIIIYKKNL